jgi:hypothetical protein
MFRDPAKQFAQIDSILNINNRAGGKLFDSCLTFCVIRPPPHQNNLFAPELGDGLNRRSGHRDGWIR